MTGGAVTPEQEQYLRERHLGVFATGRKDGSPQLTLVAYDFDGTDIVFQTGGGSVKARNATRVPSVAFLVQDERLNLVLYGTVEVLREGAARREAIRRVRGATGREASSDDSTLDAELDERGFVAVRVLPVRAMGRIE